MPRVTRVYQSFYIFYCDKLDVDIFTWCAGSFTPEDKITLFLCTVTFAQAALAIERICTVIGTFWTVVSR